MTRFFWNSKTHVFFGFQNSKKASSALVDHHDNENFFYPRAQSNLTQIAKGVGRATGGSQGGHGDELPKKAEMIKISFRNKFLQVFWGAHGGGSHWGVTGMTPQKHLHQKCLKNHLPEKSASFTQSSQRPACSGCNSATAITHSRRTTSKSPWSASYVAGNCGARHSKQAPKMLVWTQWMGTLTSSTIQMVMKAPKNYEGGLCRIFLIPSEVYKS